MTFFKELLYIYNKVYETFSYLCMDKDVFYIHNRNKKMNVITKTVSLPDGRTISIETGKLAKQADGAVMLRMNNTVLLATVCGAKDAVPGTDFMPLQVEYREKYSAAGRFPGGFTKREGKANDDEILTCRLVDRALRPLFPSDYHAEVYVNVSETPFSAGDLYISVLPGVTHTQGLLMHL